MAAIEPNDRAAGASLLQQPLPDVSQWHLRYDEQQDTLYIWFGDRPRSAVSVDVDGAVWLRIAGDSNEVVGLEFEDFERVFLPRHPEIQASWQAERSWRPSDAQHRPVAVGGFLATLRGWLRALANVPRSPGPASA